MSRRLRYSVDGFTQQADTVLSQYLRRLMLVMPVLAAFYSAGLSLFGFDLGLPIDVFTVLDILVSYLGFGLGLSLANLTGLSGFACT